MNLHVSFADTVRPASVAIVRLQQAGSNGETGTVPGPLVNREFE